MSKAHASITLHQLGTASEIRYVHAVDRKRYAHKFKGAKVYHAVIGGRTFVMIETPGMVTHKGRKYIGEDK